MEKTMVNLHQAAQSSTLKPLSIQDLENRNISGGGWQDCAVFGGSFLALIASAFATTVGVGVLSGSAAN